MSRPTVRRHLHESTHVNDDYMVERLYDAMKFCMGTIREAEMLTYIRKESTDYPEMIRELDEALDDLRVGAHKAHEKIKNMYYQIRYVER